MYVLLILLAGNASGALPQVTWHNSLADCRAAAVEEQRRIVARGGRVEQVSCSHQQRPSFRPPNIAFASCRGRGEKLRCPALIP